MLVLTVENPTGSVAERSKRLERGRLTIGRGEDAGWVLPDPERRLSRHHCVVEARNGVFTITDTSANGVFVEGSTIALGRDNAIELRDGMRVAIGDYVLKVTIEEAEARPPRASWFENEDGAAEAPPQAAGSRPSMLDESLVGGVPIRSPKHSPKFTSGGPATPSDHSPPESEALQPPIQAWPKAPAPPSAAAEPGSPVTQASADRRLLDAFLRGAGVDPDDFPCEDPEAQLRAAGEAFRGLATGVAQLLGSRALAKSRAGLERTMIAGSDNNPLKFSANEDEQVLCLIRHRGRGYLDPAQAIRQAFDDLKSHEIAMLEGMEAALAALLRRFDPEELERQLEDPSLLAQLVAGGRKAMYWELFKERYAEIAEKARLRFLGEVGIDFAGAYQDAAKRR